MANLTVEVSDGTDAIAGATVTLDGDSSETSGDDGKVLFEDVIVGSHTVGVEKEGYVSNSVDVNVTDDATITVVLEEEPIGREINFTLKDMNEGALSSIQIRLMSGETIVGEATTGTAGGCSMRDIPEGTYVMPLPLSSWNWTSVNGETPVTDEQNNLIVSVEGDTTLNIKVNTGEI